MTFRVRKIRSFRFLKKNFIFVCKFWRFVFSDHDFRPWQILRTQVFHWVDKLILKTLTLSRRRPLSYRNQFNDLQSKSINWFLYDNGLRHERVKCYWTYLVYFHLAVFNPLGLLVSMFNKNKKNKAAFFVTCTFVEKQIRNFHRLNLNRYNNLLKNYASMKA